VLEGLVPVPVPVWLLHVPVLGGLVHSPVREVLELGHVLVGECGGGRVVLVGVEREEGEGKEKKEGKGTIFGQFERGAQL
jgi:hypothetical protein